MTKNTTRNTNTPVVDRLLSRCEIGDCWLWTGVLTSGGYGQMSVNGVQKYVHRLIWEELIGPIPAGYDVDHLCRVRNCVNPDHLDPVTRRENLSRGVGHGTRAYCPQGHPYNKKNTYRYPDGSRYCRVCRREGMRRLKERRKAAERGD